MNTVNWQTQREVEVLSQRSEIRRKANRQSSRRRQDLVRVDERGDSGAVQVERQDRLIDLNPRSACVGKSRQDFHIDGQNLTQQRQRLQSASPSLAQQQEGHGTQKHRTGRDAELFGLDEFVDRLRRSKTELLVRLQLRDDVVVVGVEPLGHFHRLSSLVAPRHGEAGIEVHRSACMSKSRRNRAHHDRGVQDVVVEREVVARNEVHAQIALQFPVQLAYRPGRITQFCRRQLMCPVLLQRLLQLSLGSHPRKPQIGHSYTHDRSSKNWM